MLETRQGCAHLAARTAQQSSRDARGAPFEDSSAHPGVDYFTRRSRAVDTNKGQAAGSETRHDRFGRARTETTWMHEEVHARGRYGQRSRHRPAPTATARVESRRGQQPRDETGLRGDDPVSHSATFSTTGLAPRGAGEAFSAIVGPVSRGS